MIEDDPSYFSRREKQELLLAAAAPRAEIEAVHLELAKLYAEARAKKVRAKRLADARIAL